jgi:hypothetical protein
MRICLTLLAAVFLAAPAAAQESFKQIWVTHADSGDVVRGRMVELSRESLVLLTPDNRRVTMPIDSVLRIEGHGDSLKNGAAIGAGVMASLALLTCAGVGDAGGFCARAAVFQTAFGALMGAGIDALNGGRSTLYKKEAPAKSVGVSFKMRW